MEKAHPLLLNFKDLTDPRVQKHRLRHKLIDILMLTIIAVFDEYEVIDGDHGRVEARRYWITEDIEWLKQKKIGLD